LLTLPPSVRTNNEVQQYSPSNANLQLSGGSTVQLVPWRDQNTGEWTSARIETKFVFTPAAGKLTTVEALIRLGENPLDRRQGLWPAFWMLGDSIHHGTEWPICGEIDILETVSGHPLGHGTLHCGRNQGHGGPCNEPIGRGGAVSLPDYAGWHTWTVQIDRRDTSRGFRSETIRWLRDGAEWFVVRGEDIGDEGVWATLAHSPLFIILNVAVGGDW
jgi:beta-glucanase (GH16 family)